VLRLLGALRLKAQTRATCAKVKRQLDTFSMPELERWLIGQGLNPAVAVELGIATLATKVAPTSKASSGPATEHAAAFWQRTELLPGLELFLSATASAAVKHAAQRMTEHRCIDLRKY
jgi:hypothetical protein